MTNRSATAGTDQAADDPQSRPAHLTVLVSGVFHTAYIELLPAFEQGSGLTVDSHLSPSMGESRDSVSHRLERGEPADVLVMAAPGLDRVVSAGMAIPETRVTLATAPIGIAVRADSPEPDISTADKLRDVLLAARSVAYSISASGKYVSGELFEALGIKSQMSGKAHRVEGTTPVAETVANGTYEIGFQSLSELGMVGGVTLVGALPDPVGRSTVVAAAVAAKSEHRQEAAALLRYLSSPDLTPVLRKHGLEPPARPYSERDHRARRAPERFHPPRSSALPSAKDRKT